MENKDELIPILSEQFKQKDADTWMNMLNEEGIPVGPIHNMKQLFESEQVQARNMVETFEHPTAGNIQLVGSPLKFSKTKVEMKSPPPLVGEHTENILLQLGYSKADIQQMAKKKII